ncbi:MAG: PAS domain S-box protein [Nocardioidaceae bacterium]|nr:PAS domain S-box protein [Nocardioidaceae bacterium]NUS50311.1 PAS domain S-box protein [Nocardioidaceae bacterium]
MSGTEAETLPTVVIVDDAAEVRSLVRTRLRLSHRVHVVGEGVDGNEAVELARTHGPDLMLLDVSMPGMDGLEALPLVREASPRTTVVMFSGFEEHGLAQRLVGLGAAAFLEKSSSLETLADDLLAVLGGPPRRTTPTVAASTAEEDRERRVIEEHLERFRELFEEAAIGMVTLTLTGQVVRANRAFARLVEREVDDLVGTPYGELAADRREALDAALTELQGNDVDLLPVEHDVVGTEPVRRVLTTLTPIRDSAGRPLYLFLQVQDVSAMRAAEEDLRRAEERFRLLVESVRDHAIFMLDATGHIASWNPGAQRIKGYAAEEVLGRHFRMFYPPALQEARHPEHELEVALREGRYEEEGWRVRKDGSQFWANVVISAVHDRSGRHIGFAKVTRDMTGRRAAEEGLRQSEERFRLLVESVQDYAIFMLDPDGHVMSWNAGAERSKGWTADEIIGQHFRVFHPPQQQAVRHPEHELELALRDGHYQEEGWRVRKDGTRYWAHVTISAVHNDLGEHVGFTKVTRDTTERRQLMEQQDANAEEIASANARLEEANRRLSQSADDQSKFLAVTAHELRTPVSVLAGTAETLGRHWSELDDLERAEMLEGMSTSATRLRLLLADLLTASRLQRSALELHLEPVAVDRLLAAAVSAAARSHPGVEVLAVATPGLWVRADADRISQALDNLVTNAVGHGRPPVRLEARADDTTVTLQVSDTGAGVTDVMRGRLFERFATGGRRGGTGLGLFIVRELARAHGGEATYEPPSEAAPAGAFLLTLARVDGP